MKDIEPGKIGKGSHWSLKTWKVVEFNIRACPVLEKYCSFLQYGMTQPLIFAVIGNLFTLNCLILRNWIKYYSYGSYIGNTHTDTPWWLHQMETFLVLLALYAGNWPVAGEFPHKGQWRGALMFYFDLRLNKGLIKQLWGWWLETPSRSLWCHCNAHTQPGIKALSVYPPAQLQDFLIGPMQFPVITELVGLVVKCNLIW